MISKLSRQEKLIFAAVFLALLTHFVSTLRQTYVEPLAARKVEDSAAAPMPQRNVNDVQASSEAFSTLFGVKPQTDELKTELPKVPDTLKDMQPKLLAIDEQAGVLTARLWLEKAENNKLTSVVTGQVLFEFKLSSISRTQVEFEPDSNNPDLKPFTLTLFAIASEN